MSCRTTPAMDSGRGVVTGGAAFTVDGPAVAAGAVAVTVAVTITADEPAGDVAVDAGAAGTCASLPGRDPTAVDGTAPTAATAVASAAAGPPSRDNHQRAPKKLPT